MGIYPKGQTRQADQAAEPVGTNEVQTEPGRELVPTNEVHAGEDWPGPGELVAEGREFVRCGVTSPDDLVPEAPRFPALPMPSTEALEALLSSQPEARLDNESTSLRWWERDVDHRGRLVQHSFKSERPPGLFPFTGLVFRHGEDRTRFMAIADSIRANHRHGGRLAWPLPAQAPIKRAPAGQNHLHGAALAFVLRCGPVLLVLASLVALPGMRCTTGGLQLDKATNQMVAVEVTTFALFTDTNVDAQRDLAGMARLQIGTRPDGDTAGKALDLGNSAIGLLRLNARDPDGTTPPAPTNPPPSPPPAPGGPVTSVP